MGPGAGSLVRNSRSNTSQAMRASERRTSVNPETPLQTTTTTVSKVLSQRGHSCVTANAISRITKPVTTRSFRCKREPVVAGSCRRVDSSMEGLSTSSRQKISRRNKRGTTADYVYEPVSKHLDCLCSAVASAKSQRPQILKLGGLQDLRSVYNKGSLADN